MKKSKILFFMVSVSVSLAILYGVSYLTSAQKTDPHFTYETGAQTGGYVQVISGNAVDVPFSFDIGGAAFDVRLEIQDQQFAGNGAFLAEEKVAVKDGMASSKATLRFAAKQIKPGTYFLTIDAKDKAGTVIRTGTIPFTVDMQEIVATCSC